MIKISAIVVTYNRKRLLKQCLQHLLTQKYSINTIFVINNNSTDGTTQYLDNINNKKIIVKTLNKNIGGAGGFSIGTKLAYNMSDSDYFWLMDDDTMPTYLSLSKLVSAAKNIRHIGFLCSNVRWWKDNRPVNVPNVTSDWTLKLPGNLIKVHQASFVSCFVSRTVVKNIGLPIAQMFIWGDDYEYTSRISKYGYNSYFVSDSVVIHKSSENNSDENICNTNRLLYYKFMYRNYLLNDKKYKSYKRFGKDVLLNIILSIKVLFSSKNHRFKRFYCVLSSTIKGIFFNPKIHFP